MVLGINVYRAEELGVIPEVVYTNTYSSRIESIFPPLRYAFYKGFEAAIQDAALKKLSTNNYRVEIIYETDFNDRTHFTYDMYIKDGFIRYESPSYKEGKLLTNTKTVLVSEIEKKYRVKLS